MIRTLRERARAKFARALHEYVVVEVGRDFDRATSELVAMRDRLQSLENLVQNIERGMPAWERRQRRDLLTVADQIAARSSAEFHLREMPRAKPWFSKVDTLTAAVKAASPQGLYLEFGVHTGGTLRTIAELAPTGSVYGFDSFEGLPEDWRAHFATGHFAVDQIPDVPGAELVVGWFDQVLPGFLAEHPEDVAFLHLDADLYSSTKTVLDALEPRLRVGTVIIFDEYFNFPGWEEHEHRAWTEFVARTGIEFEYLGFTADDEQISLRLTAVPGRADS